MPADPQDPISQAHRILDQQQALTVSWVLPPLVFGAATFGGLVAELPELALALGIATLLSGAVGAALAWDRLRRIRAVREILERARQKPRDADT